MTEPPSRQPIHSSRHAAELACGNASVEAYNRVKSFYTKLGKALERSFAEAVGGRVGVPPEPDLITSLGEWELATSYNGKNSSGARAQREKVPEGHIVTVIGTAARGTITGLRFLELHGVQEAELEYDRCLRQAMAEARSVWEQPRLWGSWE